MYLSKREFRRSDIIKVIWVYINSILVGPYFSVCKQWYRVTRHYNLYIYGIPPPRYLGTLYTIIKYYYWHYIIYCTDRKNKIIKPNEIAPFDFMAALYHGVGTGRTRYLFAERENQLSYFSGVSMCCPPPYPTHNYHSCFCATRCDLE